VGAPLPWRSERLGNRLQHAGSVSKNVVVPKAEDVPALAPQPLVAVVMVARTRVLAAIDFDDQSGFDAGKIGNVGWNRELTPKAPAKLALSKLPPQCALGISRIAA